MIEYYYSFGAFYYRPEDPDDTIICGMTRHCIPQRFTKLPQAPVSLDELQKEAQTVMDTVSNEYIKILWYIKGNVEGQIWEASGLEPTMTIKELKEWNETK